MRMLSIALIVSAISIFAACAPSATAQSTAPSGPKPELVYSAALSVDGRWVKLPPLNAENGKVSKLTHAAPGSPTNATFELTVTPEILADGQIRSAVTFSWKENGAPFQTEFTVVTANRQSSGVAESSSTHEYVFEIRATRP